MFSINQFSAGLGAVYPGGRFSDHFPEPPFYQPVTTTIVFRKTLSQLGTRVGSRPVQQ